MKTTFQPIKIGRKTFNFSRPYLMGILNVTPDSFSDGGQFLNSNKAAEHALKMFEDGVDIIDIGGESTRPGAEGVSEDVEINRVLPVVEKIIAANNDIIISVDTTKSIVAEAVLEAGALIINDISGLTFEPNLASAAAKHDAALVIMHIKGTPRDMQKNISYNNLIVEISEFLKRQSLIAQEAGVKKIIVDPGIGFGKNIDNNFEIISRLSEFKSLNFPLLIGLSRKSFLGKALDLETDERDTASSIMEAISIAKGANFIRTHNVKNGIQVCRLMEKIGSINV